MYDTVCFRIECNTMGDPFIILPYLNNITELRNEWLGYSYKGELDNYKVYVSQTGISLIGSLAKFYLPSNVYTLTREATREAIEKMSDKFHTDISDAKVTRFDVSTVIPTKRSPKDYFSSLGDKPYFERVQATKDTLYYNTQKRQLIFYDKNKEAKSKNVIIPPALEGKNLLRYELRYLNELKRGLMDKK